MNPLKCPLQLPKDKREELRKRIRVQQRQKMVGSQRKRILQRLSGEELRECLVENCHDNLAIIESMAQHTDEDTLRLCYPKFLRIVEGKLFEGVGINALATYENEVRISSQKHFVDIISHFSSSHSSDPEVVNALLRYIVVCIYNLRLDKTHPLFEYLERADVLFERWWNEVDDMDLDLADDYVTEGFLLERTVILRSIIPLVLQFASITRPISSNNILIIVKIFSHEKFKHLREQLFYDCQLVNKLVREVGLHLQPILNLFRSSKMISRLQKEGLMQSLLNNLALEFCKEWDKKEVILEWVAALCRKSPEFTMFLIQHKRLMQPLMFSAPDKLVPCIVEILFTQDVPIIMGLCQEYDVIGKLIEGTERDQTHIPQTLRILRCLCQLSEDHECLRKYVNVPILEKLRGMMEEATNAVGEEHLLTLERMIDHMNFP